MKAKFEEIVAHFEDLNEKLSDPKVINNQEKYRELAKTHSDLSPLANKVKELLELDKNVTDAKEMLKAEDDSDMTDYLQDEIKNLESSKDELIDVVKVMMLPRDPNDEKDIIMEIRAGAGGREASIFAGDLYRLYTKYAEGQKWKTDIMSSSPSEMGGFKEIIVEIKGRGAYSKLKFESGVHRVQRIPVTESGGRIHTSTATVAVLPGVEDIEVNIKQNDIRIDIFRSSGPGGQSVNTTDSAVRITHLSTGLVVSCQDEKSQLQNKEKALRILRARLYTQLQEEQQSEVASARRLQIGTGDRSERIRTYNYPQGRVTDHRIGLTLYNLDSILEGEIDEIIESLITADKAEKLKEVV